jgi:hypothetical protein
MSHISAAPLRTTNWVFQIGSKLARSACGTKRSVRAAARCEIAGVARPPAAATEPAAVFKNVRRSMMFTPRNSIDRFRYKILLDAKYSRHKAPRQTTNMNEWWCKTKKDAGL